MNEAQIEQMATALRNGTDLETACHYAGLSSTEVLRLLEQGKVEAERVSVGQAPNPVHAIALQLWDDMKKARADAIVRNVTYVQRAASDGNWQAAAWWLERTVPETYSKRSPKQSSVEGKPASAIEAEG
jgi:hypothetical protein